MGEKELDDIIEKYKKKIGEHIDPESIGQAKASFDDKFSKEYLTFREEIISKKRSQYEEWCNKAERIFKFSTSKKQLPKIKESIEAAHLQITPTGAASLSVLVSLSLILLGLVAGAFLNMSAITQLLAKETVTSTSFTFPIFIMILGVLALYILNRMPIYIANRWRLQAGNQMVLCILYIIVYMRHTSNLENAIKFSSEHIGPPLSLDLRKVFWDVEIGRFSTIKESLDYYLIQWRKYNLEFVTAFNLIQSSLYEPTESRRVTLLEKSLKVMLDSTYERMLHFAQGVKGPITTLHMLGVILPILGLVIFPLLGAFLSGIVKWYHLAILYNILLPLLVYIVGTNILSKRPTGYQDSTVAKEIFKKKKGPFLVALAIGLFFIFIGLIPLFASLGVADPTTMDFTFSVGGDLQFDFFGYKEGPDGYYGPFGLGALIFSFFIPLGLALGIGYYYKKQSADIIDIRKETKNLELEFSSALFQLGNRIGDGVPAEVAFSKVSSTLSNTPAGRFFKIVDLNIRNLGMGLKEAIFNPKTGAILAYPSPLIESSMEVLLESSAKGPSVTSRSLISISNYVDKIHRVNERLKDLLSEVVSSMKTQTSFLTPAIAAIVVGVSSMVVTILTGLQDIFTQQAGTFGDAGGVEMSAGLLTVIETFGVEGVIPGYHFQLVVGIYVVEIAIVLLILQNGIENASDKVFRNYSLGKSLIRSTMLYVVIAVIVVILFNILIGNVITANFLGG